jgi:hypothetical protein
MEKQRKLEEEEKQRLLAEAKTKEEAAKQAQEGGKEAPATASGSGCLSLGERRVSLLCGWAFCHER